MKNVDFYHGDERIEGILPSEHFTSAWMSEGAEDEWIMVDLGTVRKVDSVPPVWISAPKACELSVSRDGESWKAFSPGRWRFVRLDMHGDGSAHFCLTELEVLGPSFFVPRPPVQVATGGHWFEVATSPPAAALSF